MALPFATNAQHVRSPCYGEQYTTIPHAPAPNRRKRAHGADALRRPARVRPCSARPLCERLTTCVHVDPTRRRPAGATRAVSPSVGSPGPGHTNNGSHPSQSFAERSMRGPALNKTGCDAITAPPSTPRSLTARRVIAHSLPSRSGITRHSVSHGGRWEVKPQQAVAH